MHITNEFTKIELEGVTYGCLIHHPIDPSAQSRCLVYDMDSEIETRLKNYIEQHRKSATIRKNRGTFHFGRSRDGASSITLAAFLYACYNGLSLEAVRSRSVRHKHSVFLDADKTIEDCRSCNLIATGEIGQSDRFKTFEIYDESFFSIHLNAYDITDFYSYTPELYEILCTRGNFDFFVNAGGRTQARLNGIGHNDNKYPYVSWIAKAYYDGLLTVENYKEFLAERLSVGDGLAVDHLDSDIHNNCRENLIVIPSSMNLSKRHFTSAFPEGCTAYFALTGNAEEIVLEFMHPRIQDGRMTTNYYRFENLQKLLDFLNVYYGRKDSVTKNLSIRRVSESGITTVRTPTTGHPKIEKNTKESIAETNRVLSLYRRCPAFFKNWECDGKRFTLSEASDVLPQILSIF